MSQWPTIGQEKRRYVTASQAKVIFLVAQECGTVILLHVVFGYGYSNGAVLIGV